MVVTDGRVTWRILWEGKKQRVCGPPTSAFVTTLSESSVGNRRTMFPRDIPSRLWTSYWILPHEVLLSILQHYTWDQIFTVWACRRHAVSSHSIFFPSFLISFYYWGPCHVPDLLLIKENAAKNMITCEPTFMDLIFWWIESQNEQTCTKIQKNFLHWLSDKIDGVFMYDNLG